MLIFGRGKRVKKLLPVVLVGILAILTACSASEPAYVNSSPPINVNVAGGTVSANITLPNPLPVSGNVTATIPGTVTVNGTVTTSGDPVEPTLTESVQLTGLFLGKTAKVFHILGRRAGFTSTTILNDIKEFDNSVAATPTMTGLENLEIVSSSANDTLGGTGTNKVKITYLDTSNNMVESSDVSTNGTTPVSIAWHANDIYWMESSLDGSNSVAVGNIVLRIVGPGAQLEQISAGGNKSLSARFTVPAGYTGYVSTWDGSAIVTSGAANTDYQELRLRATVDTFTRASTPGIYHFQDIMFASAQQGVATLDIPFFSMPQLTKIKVSTYSSGTSSVNRADCSFVVVMIHS